MSWLGRLLSGWNFDEQRSGAAVAPHGDPERVRAVQAVLERLRPLLAADGGGVELIAVEGNCVRIRMQGACRSCSAAQSTIASSIAPQLRAELAWVESIEATP